MKLLTMICLVVAGLVAIAFVASIGAIVYVYVSDNIFYDSHPKLPFKDEYGQDLYLDNNRSATNPTFDQLIAFLRQDRTELEGTGTGDILTTLHDNAEARGIRAGVAEMRPAYTTNTGFRTVYACNVFKTTDRGLVYVDCAMPNDAPANDYILFYNQRILGSTTYDACYIPAENLSAWDTSSLFKDALPDYEKLKSTGSLKTDLVFDGVGITW